MFQDYSIDDYKKACYIILRPDLTPEYFIRHFGMSRYEYSICQQRLKELQKFYGIEYHFEENRIHWTVTDEKQFQQHYKGMWSFYNRHRRNLTNRSELVRGLYIARKILLANDHTDLDAVSETMGFSRSNLRNAIKLCRTFLQSYNIRLENAPHYGVYPMGNEWNIRRCLMAIYSLLDVNVIPEEDYPEIAEGLSNPHYPVLRGKVYEALLHNSCNYSQAQVRRLTYYIFFQHLRIRQGRIFSGFENIHPAIIGYVRSSERLMKISADITRSCFGGEAFSEQEILSVAMMLFEMYDEPEEFCAFVEATFPEEANDLYRMVDGYLLRSYGFSITGLYSSILRTTLYRLIIHHQMGLLSEHAGHSESRAQIISDYPLVMLLYQNIQQLLAERYGNEAAGICCAPLCELIAFYIQGMDYAAPRLRIGITARSDIYAPEMIRNLLLAKLNPRYYSSVECCTYVDMLENIPEARKKYDLILCDERLSNDPLFLSYAEIRNNLNNINAYLQMLRDLFGNDLKKEDIRTQELKLSDGWAEELLAESRAFPVAAFTVEEIQKKTICVNDCLVLLLTQQTAPHSLLQFGKLKSRLRVGDKRVSRYLLLSGRVNAQNIRIINLLLYELIQDPLFRATLTSCPCPETLNNQINRLLK